MGGGGGGSIKQTSNSVAEPWSGQIPYLRDVYDQAYQQYNNGGPRYWKGAIQADTNDLVNKGQSLALNFANNQFPGAYGQLMDTSRNNLDAGYLNAMQRSIYGGLPADLNAGINNYYSQEGSLINAALPRLQQAAQQDRFGQSEAIARMQQGLAAGVDPSVMNLGGSAAAQMSDANMRALASGNTNLFNDPAYRAGGRFLSGENTDLGLNNNDVLNQAGGYLLDPYMGLNENGVLSQGSRYMQGTDLSLGGNEALQMASPFMGRNDFLLYPESNPALAGMANAATRGIQRNFSENILPGIQQDAIGAGQFGSSRQGIAEGIAARGAHENISDVYSNLYGNAYQQGLEQQTARQGQQLGFLEGLQGQNLAAETQRRAQNLGFLGDIQGQTLGAETARAGQNLGFYGDLQSATLGAETARQGASMDFLQGLSGQNLDARTRAALGMGDFYSGLQGQAMDYLQQGRGTAADFYSGMENQAAQRALTGAGQLSDFQLGLGNLAGQRYSTNVGTSADIANQIRAGTLGQQLGFAGMMPQTLQSGLMGSDIYSGVGDYYMQRQQQEINDRINQYNFNQNKPLTNLQNYMGFVGGNMGGSTSTTQQQSGGGTPLSSRLLSGGMGAIGGAAAGASLAGMFSGASGAAGGAAGGAAAGSSVGPWGAVIGGLLGALGGAFAGG